MTSSFTELYPSYRSETSQFMMVPQSSAGDWVSAKPGSNLVSLPGGGVGHILPYQTQQNLASPENTFSNMVYHGGPIQKAPKIVLILWGFGTCTKSGCTNDPNKTEAILYNLARDIGGSTLFSTTTQYYSTAQGNITNPVNTLISFLVDKNAAPTKPTTAQIQVQVVDAQHFLKMGNNKDVDYIVSLGYRHDPPGFGPGGFCAFHTAFGTKTSPQPFTVDPYVTEAGTGCGAYTVQGPDDGVSVVLGHELAEATTDPGLNAWYDSDGLSGEIGDKCANRGFNQDIYLRNNGLFPMQPLWSNKTANCVF
ncbi:MAG: hypothetical protein ABI282_03510 [Candidatus Baltobacteraceae bacterium]